MKRSRYDLTTSEGSKHFWSLEKSKASDTELVSFSSSRSSLGSSIFEKLQFAITGSSETQKSVIIYDDESSQSEQNLLHFYNEAFVTILTNTNIDKDDLMACFHNNCSSAIFALSNPRVVVDLCDKIAKILTPYLDLKDAARIFMTSKTGQETLDACDLNLVM